MQTLFFDFLTCSILDFVWTLSLLTKCHSPSPFFFQYLFIAANNNLSAWMRRRPFSLISISSSALFSSSWRSTLKWHWIPSCDKKFLLMPGNFFLWQEISSDARKFLPVTGHFCLWQEISSCDKKFLPVTRNFFLWQEIYNYGMKFLPLTKSFFLWQEISSNAKKFLPKTINFFLWQENIKISCMLCWIGGNAPFDRK